MLLQDYNYSEGLLDIYSDDEVLLKKVNTLLTEPSRTGIVEKLRNESLKQKQLSEQMWQQVFKKIKDGVS